MLKNKKVCFSIFILIISFVAFCGFCPHKASARTIDSIPNSGILYGTAWAPNLGEISFNNCSDVSDVSSCDTSEEYEVIIKNNGSLEGWAWSDHAGWIKFDNTLCHNNVCGSKVTRDSDGNITAITGWAKVIDGTPNANSASSNGWDGLVSLGDPNYTTYGVSAGAPSISGSLKTQDLAGWAWGSTVVGGVDMSGVKVATKTSSLTLYGNGSTGPVDVTFGDPIALSATGENLNTGISCTPGGAADWIATGSKNAPTSDTTPTPYNPSLILPAIGQYSFTLTCDGSDGSDVVSNAVVVNVLKGLNPVLPIDGACGSAHWTCSAGTLSNASYSNSNLTWTWKCLGINLGSDASCSKTNITTECSQSDLDGTIPPINVACYCSVPEHLGTQTCFNPPHYIEN